jgi:hypothetical protein
VLGPRSVRFGAVPPSDAEWGEVLSAALGRATSEKITAVAVFPAVGLLGDSKSLLMGFDDGAILKYNSNKRKGVNMPYTLFPALLHGYPVQFEPPFEGKNLLPVAPDNSPNAPG